MFKTEELHRYARALLLQLEAAGLDGITWDIVQVAARLRQQQFLYDLAMLFRERYRSDVQNAADERGERWRFLPHVTKTLNSIEIRWTEYGPPRNSGSRGFTRGVRGTVNRSGRYAASTFKKAPAWELEIILEAERAFGAMRRAKKFVEAGAEADFQARKRLGMPSLGELPCTGPLAELIDDSMLFLFNID